MATAMARNRFPAIGKPEIRFQNPSKLLFSSFSSASSAGIPPPAPPPPPIPPPPSAVSTCKEGERGKWSKLALFLPGAITLGLGSWQIVRRQEKIEMIEYRKKRLEMDPIVLNNFSLHDEDMPSLEFRKVSCEGHFVESKNIYIGPRSRSISGVTENGYYVISPLIPTSNVPNDYSLPQVPVLVNRGWVPREWRDNFLKTSQHTKKEPSTPTINIEEKEARSSWWKFWSKTSKSIIESEETIVPAAVKVVGVIRGSEKPSIFVPENNPQIGQWFYVDVSAMKHECGLPEKCIYIEDINENIKASNPYPLPKDVNTLIRHSVMPQDHLNYTITWYTLSGAVMYMAFKRIRTSKGRR